MIFYLAFLLEQYDRSDLSGVTTCMLVPSKSDEARDFGSRVRHTSDCSAELHRDFVLV